MQIYNGNEPYIFISYAHKDSAAVLPLIEGLQGRGFRVWYDAGIAAGTEWPEYIADRLCDSAVVLAFLSEAALASHNCRREINFAIAEKKEMLVVYLEDLELSRGMRMQLGVLQALYYSRFTSDAAFVAELCEAEVLEPCRDTAEPMSVTAPTQTSVQARLAEADAFFDKQQYVRAFAGYLLLAEEGNTAAAKRLGDMYYKGLGVSRNYWDAAQWYSKAFEDIKADNAFGMLFYEQEDYATALQLFQKAAEGGLPEAFSQLGLMYEEGLGVPQDDAIAFEWYQKAGEGDDAYFAERLGERYYYGEGVPQDYVAAAQWFRKAAEAGYAVAQSNLGEMYCKGEGVPQDYAAAAQWFRKAAEAGNAGAANNLGWMYYNGWGVPQNDATAVQWFRRGAEGGDAMAQNNLGWMYYNGRGCARDVTQAVYWYRKAAEQGNEAAQTALKELGY